ncbi:MAG: hypothetical protein GY795_41440 [Desulfobacterales bacterium]|nr:hypothetical protein [Desulfobacterales bacterium]
MAKLNAHPEKVQNFRNALDGYNDQLNRNVILLKTEFDKVSQTWQDSQQRQFSVELSQLQDQIQKFLKTSRDFTDYLKTKVSRINRYLGT